MKRIVILLVGEMGTRLSKELRVKIIVLGEGRKVVIVPSKEMVTEIWLGTKKGE